MIYVPTYSIDVSGNRQNIAQGFDPIHIKRQYGGIVATLLAEEIDDLEAVGDALAESLEADNLSDVDDETLEILNERMGSPELSIN